MWGKDCGQIWGTGSVPEFKYRDWGRSWSRSQNNRCSNPPPTHPNTPWDCCRCSNLTTRLLPTGRTLKCLRPKNEIFALQWCYTALIDSYRRFGRTSWFLLHELNSTRKMNHSADFVSFLVVTAPPPSQWARASSFTRFSRSHTTTHHSR